MLIQKWFLVYSLKIRRCSARLQLGLRAGHQEEKLAQQASDGAAPVMEHHLDDIALASKPNRVVWP